MSTVAKPALTDPNDPNATGGKNVKATIKYVNTTTAVGTTNSGAPTLIQTVSGKTSTSKTSSEGEFKDKDTATWSEPNFMAKDSVGNIFVSDTQAQVVKVMCVAASTGPAT